MAKPITPYSLSAPGFFGLNTSSSPVDMNPQFALEATNCVIDKSGRVASRKGWTKAHSASADLGSANVECIAELIDNDGTATTLCAGNGKLLKLSSGTLVDLTYGGGGVAPTISSNNWKVCQLNGIAMFWQRGFDPLIYDPAVSTTTYRRLNEKSGSSGTVYQCNEAISAYGRVWAADTTTDKQTVVFSDLLTPHIWTGGTSGSLDLRQVWAIGGDQVVGLAAHNNFLYIFGRKQILVYQGAEDPATMALSDVLTGIGCIARDSIQNTGEDILFLASDGVRSLLRTIQEKSAPLRTLTRNIHFDIQGYIALETLANIKSVYSKNEAFYLITFPASSVTYCIDFLRPLEDGSARITSWTNINPKALYETREGVLYLGKAGYLAKYDGYLDDTSAYRMSYFTTWIDFGNPIQTSILKKAICTVIGLSNQTVIFKWAYDFVRTYNSQALTLIGISSPAEYNVAEYGIDEYSGNVEVNTMQVNGSSAGKVLQFGLEAQINGYQVSIQRIDLYTKEGRLQ